MHMRTCYKRKKQGQGLRAPADLLSADSEEAGGCTPALIKRGQAGLRPCLTKQKRGRVKAPACQQRTEARLMPGKGEARGLAPAYRKKQRRGTGSDRPPALTRKEAAGRGSAPSPAATRSREGARSPPLSKQGARSREEGLRPLTMT